MILCVKTKNIIYAHHIEGLTNFQVLPLVTESQHMGKTGDSSVIYTMHYFICFNHVSSVLPILSVGMPSLSEYARPLQDSTSLVALF